MIYQWTPVSTEKDHVRNTGRNFREKSISPQVQFYTNDQYFESSWVSVSDVHFVSKVEKWDKESIFCSCLISGKANPTESSQKGQQNLINSILFAPIYIHILMELWTKSSASNLCSLSSNRQVTGDISQNTRCG